MPSAYPLVKSGIFALIWAREAGKTPEDLVSFLEDADNNENEEKSFLVDDGAIKHLTLPDPEKFEFPQRRLQISHLPNLTKLWCHDRMLTDLELSNLPALTTLACLGNQLTKLDLSNVPALTVLYCWGNQFTELDLSHVPALAELWCWGNQLAELDLSRLAHLVKLD